MQHHAQTGAIAIAAATLAASLPDPHQPTIILFMAGIGALVGTTVGPIRRLLREEIRELAEDASFIGGVSGAVLYLATMAEILGATPRGQVVGVIVTLAVPYGILSSGSR